MNYFAFYALWFLILFSEQAKSPYIALPIVGMYLVTHIVCFSQSPARETFLICALTVIGALNETILSLSGLVQYLGAYVEGVSWWTLSLWATFATTYWHAFSWLESRTILSCILGALVAPPCYIWIQRIGAITFPEGVLPATVAIGALWACVLPVTFWISKSVRCVERSP